MVSSIRTATSLVAPPAAGSAAWMAEAKVKAVIVARIDGKRLIGDYLSFCLFEVTLRT
jgi:hypothetical protein